MFKRLRIPLTLLGILTTLFACKTNRPKFDPDAYRANHHIEAIVNERGTVVYCDEEAFSEYAAMHKTKWTELRRLVQMLRIDPKQKQIIMENLDFVQDEAHE